MNKQNHWEPYRLFFILGLISALVGGFLWTLFQYQEIIFYPKQAHANLMIFGFLGAFVFGFLMTAVPRMTGTATAHPLEMAAGASLITSQWLLNSLNWVTTSTVIFLFQIFLLTLFLSRRIFAHKRNPPEGFVFIPFALGSAALGPIIYIYSKAMPDGIFQNSEVLLYLWSGQAFLLNLICGLGSRLIPVLSRLPQALTMTEASSKSLYRSMLVKAVLLNLTFALESWISPRWGIPLRAAWIFMFAVQNLGLFVKPLTWSYLGIGLKSGITFLFIGYTLASIFPDQQLHYLHLVFIGSFSLITLMVGTRVVLAHGGQNLQAEIEARPLLVIIFLFLLSGLFRAFLYPVNFQQGLLAGVITFSLAIALWFIFLGRHVFSNK